MPDINNYHAFQSTSGGGGSGSGSGGGGGGGGSVGCLPWVLAGLFILWLIGKLC